MEPTMKLHEILDELSSMIKDIQSLNEDKQKNISDNQQVVKKMNADLSKLEDLKSKLESSTNRSADERDALIHEIEKLIGDYKGSIDMNSDVDAASFNAICSRLSRIKNGVLSRVNECAQTFESVQDDLSQLNELLNDLTVLMSK